MEDAELLGLLQQQSQKIDLLLERVASKDTGSEASTRLAQHSSRRSISEDRPLPFFQSPTHSLFCINLADSTPERHFSPSRGEISENVAPSDPKQFGFSIVRDKIIQGPSSDISETDLDCGQAPSPQPDDYLSQHSYADIYQLLQRYQDVVGIFYPILPLQRIANELDSWFNKALPSRTTINRLDLATINVAIAIASESLDEDHPRVSSDHGHKFHHLVDALVWSSKIDLKGLVFLTLVVRGTPKSLIPHSLPTDATTRHCTSFTGANGG